jgi:hypothetical protein
LFSNNVQDLMLFVTKNEKQESGGKSNLMSAFDMAIENFFNALESRFPQQHKQDPKSASGGKGTEQSDVITDHGSAEDPEVEPRTESSTQRPPIAASHVRKIWSSFTSSPLHSIQFDICAQKIEDLIVDQKAVIDESNAQIDDSAEEFSEKRNAQLVRLNAEGLWR